MLRDRFIKLLLLIGILIFTIFLGLVLGVDSSIKSLVLIMCIDYCLGISLAIIKQSKHGDGGLSSRIGYKGIVRKITMLLLVGLSIIIDTYLINNGISKAYIKDVAVIGFALNEIISITENAQLIGLNIPSFKQILFKYKDDKKGDDK